MNMRKHRANRAITVLNTVFAVLTGLFCIFLLSACNRTADSEETVERDYELYLSDLKYSEDDGAIYAVVTRTGSDDERLGAKWHWITRSYAQDIWYNRQDVEMKIDSAILYSEIENRIADYDFGEEIGEYNRLIVALRYDTIYKSVKSDGEAVKSGRYYLHSFYIDGDAESQTHNLALKTQNSANWYTMLIGCAIAIAVALTGVSLALKGGVWQKKKKKSA